MVDLPNVVAGFVAGVLTTLVFWIIDRKRDVRVRREEAWEAWKVAAKEIELMAWNRDTTADDLYRARVRYPTDHWRNILGTQGQFELLGELELAFHTLEHQQRKYSGSYSDDSHKHLLEAVARKQSAITEFANFSRRSQSEGYNKVMNKEQRRALRKSYRLHPIRTLRRQHNNKKTRQASYLANAVSTDGSDPPRKI